MKLLCLLTCASFLFCMAPARSDPVWFVFLVRGENHAPKDKVEEMQAAHIGNFKKLFAAHKLLAAGPLQDPTNFRRGIVVLRVPSAEAVRQCFNTDPYVQAGVMHLEVYRWETNAKGINIKAIDPNAIEENRIALLFLGPAHNAVGSHWPRVAPGAKGYVYGAVEGAGEVKEIRLFRGKDGDGMVRQAFATDRHVRNGRVRAVVMPLWMAKGTLESN